MSPGARTRHLVIDGRCIGPRPTGVGNALLYLLHGLNELKAAGERPAGRWRLSVIRRLPQGDPVDPFASFPELHQILAAPTPEDHPAGELWQQHRLPRLLRRMGADVLYSPAFVGPLRVPCRHLLMLHDDLLWSQPASYPLGFRFYLRTMAAMAARRANLVLTPSKDAARRLRRRIGLPASRLAVIPHGLPAATPPPEPLEGRHPFVLCVANGEPRKNHEVLLRALAHQSALQVRFLGFGPEQKERLRQLQSIAPRGARWELLAEHEPQAVAGLLRRAAALALPSRAEGFGLPVLEAMAAGTPLILSDLPVFREIAGNAAVYLPPDDTAAWAKALHQATAPGPELRARVAEGQRRARHLTAKRSASKFLRLASRLLP